MADKMKYTTISEYLDTDDPNLILEHNTIAAAKASKQEEIFVQLCMDIRKSFPEKSNEWVEKQARTVVRTNPKNVDPNR